MRKKTEFQAGQAIILVVLMMVVVLTIGLAVSTRTTTDISMSRQLEQSQRAFSAAEAGIETALLSAGGTEGSGQAGSASYRYVIKDTDQAEFIFPGLNAKCSGNTCKDDSFQFWLKDETSSYNADRIKVAWGLQSSSDIPAIEIAVLYQDGGVYKLRRWAFDPQGRAGFSTIADSPITITGTAFKYNTDLNLPTGVSREMIRGKLFYTKDNQAAFKSLDGGIFPKQGKLIESTGRAEQTTRKIEVFSGYDLLGGFFDQAIFSKDSLIGDQ